jgi:hypothetical protein
MRFVQPTTDAQGSRRLIRSPARLWEIGVLAAALALIVWQLFVPPVLSVANNNDFQRLAGPICIGPDPVVRNELFDYANVHWLVSKAGCIQWPFRTSAEFVVQLALILDRAFGFFPAFDLRWIGVVYTLLFLASFAWVQRLLRPVRPSTSLVLQIAFLVVICNAVYIPMFNTFYFDGITLVALIAGLAGTGALLLQDQVMTETLVVTSLALTLLAASKGQHALLAVLCLPALWLTRKRKVFPPLRGRIAGSVAILAGAAFTLVTIPREYEGQATFNALLFRILPAVPNPADYLKETRIPAFYLSAIGTHSYFPESINSAPQQQIAFARMFGVKDLALLYLRHPDRAWYMMKISLDEASLDRVRMKIGTKEYRLGNYERSTGRAPQSLSGFFGIWPILKGSVIGGHPRRHLLYILVIIAAAWWSAPRRPGMRWLIGILTGMLVISFATSLTDGVDAGRHLQVFNYLLDLTVCGVAASAWERFAISG